MSRRSKLFVYLNTSVHNLDCGTSSTTCINSRGFLRQSGKHQSKRGDGTSDS